jgi:hypothetical protein
MNDDKLDEIAMGGIEHGLDVDPEDSSPDEVYDDAYNLAFDALHDAGIPDEQAREVARRNAMKIAQP